jgi:3-deoxy-D-manno-octulosonate 8-phosphate phosphatase (KDO 8-P phosphatase)
VIGDAVSLVDRCKSIELLLLDVDGVLTDGAIVYGGNGLELKSFHVRDGSGIKVWRQAGKKAAILSGRSSPAVDVRAKELDIEPVIQGAASKMAGYRQILATSGTIPGRVCVIGDDIPDLPLLYNCGLAVAVADACPDVIANAHYVTRAAGGRGAVREVIEMILGCQKQWQSVVARLVNESLSAS